jgi:hypothetical protein
MRKYLLILLVLIALQKVNGQSNDSILLTNLSKPIINCENIAFNSQQAISSISINHPDSIYEILKTWEKYCEGGEVKERIKILIELNTNKYSDSLHLDYLTDKVNIFKNRYYGSISPYYLDRYQNYKGYFNYVPLRSSIDKWSKRNAQLLIPKYKVGTTEYLLCVLFSEDLIQFDRLIKSSLYSNNLIIKKDIERKREFADSWMKANFLFGLWIPDNRLKSKFGISPTFGMSAGFPLGNSNKYRLDIGMHIYFLNKSKPYFIYVEDSQRVAKSKIGISIGPTLNREFKLKNSWSSNYCIGLNFSTIETDVKKKIQKDPNTNDPAKYSIQSFDLNFGGNIKRRWLIKNYVGLQILLHYAPYVIDPKTPKKFGSSFITTSLLIGF